DLPYFLRAYFAFKMGLPFGYSKCTRGGGGEPPRCHEWWNIQNLEENRRPTAQQPPQPQLPQPSASPFDLFGQQHAATTASVPPAVKPSGPPPRPGGLVPGFGHYLRYYVADGVHSGSGRTAANDNNTDYYPVPLSEDTLRPGTTYADPYGHLLVIARR